MHSRVAMAPVLSPDNQNQNKQDVKAVTATSASEEDEECVYTLLDFQVVPQRYGICSTRVFDIFNVKLHSKGTKCGSDEKMCGIYGLVQVVDEEINSKYNVYYRKQSEPEIIKCGGELLLGGFPVIQASKFLQVFVNLYCTSHNAMIADGSFDLDYTGAYNFDQVIPNYVYGQDGSVCVHHITYQHASIAFIEEVVVEGNHVADIDLFGSVVMYLEGNRASDFDTSEILLFDNLLPGSTPVKYNQKIKLSRSFLVVPGFHSLRIQLKFHDHSGALEILKDMILEVDSTTLYEERVDENSVIKLRIEWPSFYNRCLRQRERNFTQKLSAEEIFHLDTQSIDFNTEVKAGGQSTFAYLPFEYCSFVEVFSVLPCTQDDDLDIYGTIKLIDSLDNVCSIFDGREKLFKSKPLPITCYPSNCDCTDDGFRIEVDLKGIPGHTTIGKGIESSNDCTIGLGIVYWTDSYIELCSNRHMCSLFKGDNGYVAIHYAMISRSVIARITTSVVEIGQGPQVLMNVFGNIKAGYGSYEYATKYDKDLYRSTLFSRNSDECVEVKLGSELPLSKCVIAVPADDSLVLDVKLGVKLVSEEEYKTIEQEVCFKPYACGLYAIEMGNWAISICVQWSSDEMGPSTSYSIIPNKRSLQNAMASLNV